MEKTLLQWLNNKKEVLAKYDAAEIKWYARINLFPENEIQEVLLTWVRNRDTRSSYRNRRDYRVGNEIAFLEEIHDKKMNLGDQWLALYHHVEYGLDFDDITYKEVA